MEKLGSFQQLKKWSTTGARRTKNSKYRCGLGYIESFSHAPARAKSTAQLVEMTALVIWGHGVTLRAQ